MSPEDLVEIEEIKRLKYRYARLLDTKQWDELETLFTPDATASYSGGQLSFDGRDAIMGFLRQALGSSEIITVHAMGQPEIELTGPASARGTWALQDQVILVEPGTYVRGASFYEDRYAKLDGVWLFEHTGYRRVFEEMGQRPSDAQLTASWFTDGGRSRIVSS